jgi:hypothetical protein
MSIKVFNDISSINWDKSIDNDNIFVRYDFLKCYQDYHNNLEHVYVINNENRFYGHLFNVKISNISNYSRYSLFKFFLQFFFHFTQLRFFYFTNSFLTNIPSFSLNNFFYLDKIIINVLKEKEVDFIVIPDFLFENPYNIFRLNRYVKVEVEEEMVLNISKDWLDFNSYKSSLKTKYRKRINNIYNRSKNLEIKPLSDSYIQSNKDQIQQLFDNVTEKSSFKGAVFNAEALYSLINKYKSFHLYGYFIDNKLLAFSSDFSHEDKLYSYFVGIDYSCNKKYSLYERILCETISNAIKLRKHHLVFGRTANEFKSNFGAVPKKSYVYILVKNKYLRIVLNRILTKIKPRKWAQRFPFKSFD